MCLLDRILASGDTWLEAEVMIGSDNLFCDGESIGAWVGIEYMAQAIAAFAGVRARRQGHAVKLGFLIGTRKYASHWPAFPLGSCLQVRVDQQYEADNGLAVFDCRLSCAQEDVASATITVFQPADPAGFLTGQRRDT